MVRWTGRALTGKIEGKAARLIAGGVLAASALLPNLSPADAGEWKIVAGHYSGTKTIETQGQPTRIEGLQNVVGNELPDVYWTFSTGSSEGNTHSVISYSEKIDGSVHVTLEWQRSPLWVLDENDEVQVIDDPDDNPPPVVWLRVRASASATAESDSTGNRPMPGKEEATASVTNGKLETNYNGNGASARSVTPLLLIPVETGGQDTVQGPECSLNAHGSIGGARVWPAEEEESADTELDGRVSAGADYSAAIDNRGVRLTRPAARGETYNAGTNTTYGHSTYSYHSESVDAEGTTWYTYIPNTQNFKAAYNSTGEGNQALEWYQWSPSDPSDTWESHTQEMPYGNPYRVSGSNEWFGQSTPGPQKKIIGYTAYHTDGASVNARYELTLHDEYEKKTHTVTPDQMFNIRPHPVGGEARCNSTGETVSVTCTGTHDWQVSASPTGALGKWMAKVLGIALNVSVGASSGAESSHAVTDMTIGQTTYLEIYDKYDVHTGTSDKWDSAGYLGEEPFEFKVPSSPKAWGDTSPQALRHLFSGTFWQQRLMVLLLEVAHMESSSDHMRHFSNLLTDVDREVHHEIYICFCTHGFVVDGAVCSGSTEK